MGLLYLYLTYDVIYLEPVQACNGIALPLPDL